MRFMMRLFFTPHPSPLLVTSVVAEAAVPILQGGMAITSSGRKRGRGGGGYLSRGQGKDAQNRRRE